MNNLSNHQRQDWITTFCYFFLFILISYLLWTAYNLKIQYNDSYAILLNARSIAQGEGETFTLLRPVLLPIIYSLFFVIENIFGIQNFGFTVTKLTSACFFPLFLWAAYKFLTQFLNKKEALCAVFLLSTNRILIHIAPFIKEDIPAAFFLMLTLNFYLKSNQHWNHQKLMITSLLISATILTRYNLMAFIFIFLVLHQLWINQRSLNQPIKCLQNKLNWQKTFYFIIIPAISFICIPLILLIYLNSISMGEALGQMILELQRLVSLHSSNESVGENFAFLIESSSWPVAILAVLGFIFGLKNKIKGTLFFGLWLGIFLFIQSFIFSHKEARYLIPLLVPLYFFTITGFVSLIKIINSIFNKKSLIQYLKLIKIIIVLAVSIFPLRNTIKECYAFRDPVYWDEFELKISQKAAALAENHQIFWVGQMYPLAPKSYIFHIEDEFYYLYHFFENVVSFMTHKPCRLIVDSKIKFVRNDDGGIFIQGIGNTVNDGDVLIINVEDKSYITKSFNHSINPLIVERIQLTHFSPMLAKSSENIIFISDPDSKAKIVITRDSNGQKIEGVGLTSKSAELYLTFEDNSKNTHYLPFEIIQGSFSAYLPDDTPAVKEIRLLSYDNVQTYTSN